MKRLNIMIAMHFEAGHIMSTFSLAKSLQSRGHIVTYLSIPDFRDLIEEQGFNVALFAEDILPRGYHSKTFSSKRSYRKHVDMVFRRYMSAITNGTLDTCLSGANPDILICDPFLSYAAIRALGLGIPAMHLFTSLFLYENSHIPPIIYGLQPDSRLRTKAAWKLMFLKFLFTKKLKNMITGEFKVPTRMQHNVAAYLQVARQSGYACKKNRTYRLNEIGFNLVLPEITMCPKAFQFPGDIPKQRVYLGDFVDLERREVPLEMDLDGKQVVYCSLGTAAATYPHAERFYQAVEEASTMRKDWLFILQISDPKATKKHHPSRNLIIADWVPQLQVLKKASAMVTHGGLNSIMECVNLEVPMVIVPGMRDQPGNAARAIHNHVALDAAMKTINANQLVSLIDRAMSSQDIRAGLRRMKALMAAESGMATCVGFIESHAAGGGDHAGPGRSTRHGATDAQPRP